MYRASLYPRQLSETDSEGNIIHWSPFDLNGNIYSGPISVDSGFWDAYIAVYPLHSLINTDVLGPKMITGWLNAYKEGGWVPKWASPGYRLSMIATMSDVSLADAIVKGIPGFDLNLAYEAIRKNAFVRPTDGIDGRGRVCFDAYAELGYIPRGENSTAGGLCSSVVSRTLNYLQSDWAISQAARVLNHSSDAVLLEAKSKEYKALFDPTTGFFRAKNLDGKFAEPFDEFLWNSDFIEGSAWQYRFYVPHDPEGLSTLYSASGFSLCDELLRAQTIPSIYHLDIGYEIPEQTELRENVWGQYGHNDQPSHHILYMFQASDPDGYRGKCAAKGMPWLRKAMTSLYKPGYDMFSGDEDNGEMSSWFILSSLGLYSLSPGSLDYNIGVPLYSKVQVNLGEGKYLNIIAENNGPDNYYVQSVSWNGKPLDTSAKSISYKDLMEGGDLVFQMGSKPFSQDTI
jgi:predicted alpha-1,2-mannosidase